jgi:hypothetical protein
VSIDYMYTWLQFMARKNQIGQITPDEAMFAINSGSNDLYYFYIGPIEQFVRGKPVPIVALGTNSRIAEKLTPFKQPNVTIPVTGQIATYPADMNALALMTTTAGKRIERIDDMDLPGRLSSVIDPIGDGFRDCYVESKLGWQVYPNTLTEIVVTYYRLPVLAVWGFTIVSGRPVYNPATSTDLEWDDLSCRNIMGRACSYLGFSFSEETLIKAGQEVKATGGI